MPKGPIRRSQLVSPFGVGAMLVVRDGTSVITAGLDHWFSREDGDTDARYLDVNEFIFEEWRLQQLLRVNHLRLPPDFRRPRAGESTPNCGLTIPFLRFPQWHFCPTCNVMKKLPLTARDRQKCDACSSAGRTRYVLQVPFVACCDAGHMTDFPWREWVHRSAAPNCDQPMKLTATGGASLAAQKIVCDCGSWRNLSGITDADPGFADTLLSRTLESGESRFNCRGMQPWLGTEEHSVCDRPLKGSLRSASNLYYSNEKTAIYIPRGDTSAPSELVALLEQPPLSTLVNTLKSAGAEILPETLRGVLTQHLIEYTDDQIAGALRIHSEDTEKELPAVVIEEDSDTSFRREEFNVLSEPRTESQLQIERAELSKYSGIVGEHFSQLMLIHKLRETRAFAGFSRIRTESPLSLEDQKSMLRKSPITPSQSWLPAYVVHGEGIFLMFREDRLREWEERTEVLRRANHLEDIYAAAQRQLTLEDREISPRFLLLHTLSHLLINELTFECGYSSASLRERLFVSGDSGSPMGAILIYTAAGDAEGTLGGLVRMGKHGHFEKILTKALERARWCSADPVCMELGSTSGQGPLSCNLAACHNCALLPETACEEFNRFLDRAMVIGDLANRSIGFFTADNIQ